MIGFALKHELQLERYTSANYDGTYKHSSPETIKCYQEKKLTKVITSTGEEVTSKSNYFTKEKIDELDLINGDRILSIEEFDMLGCKYYRSYT